MILVDGRNPFQKEKTKEMTTVCKANMQKIILRIQSKRNPPIPEEEALQTAKNNFMKPHLETLILARLNQGESYGYEIAQAIKTASGGWLKIPEGAMYPALYHMIQRGCITERQSNSGKHQLRVYYQITPAGRARLKALLEACGEILAGREAALAAMGENAG